MTQEWQSQYEVTADSKNIERFSEVCAIYLELQLNSTADFPEQGECVTFNSTFNLQMDQGVWLICHSEYILCQLLG